LIELVPASEEHIAPIAENMREWDRAEVAAMGRTPRQALWLGLKASTDCYTALVDGRPQAMLGLVPKNVLEGEGCPWMLGTDAIYANPRGTLTLSRKVIGIWRDSLPRLQNLVAAGNDRAIRYLRRLGFTVGEERRVIGGLEFVAFTMESADV
jgi:ribosomal protein S18 acetylase RimI-like enzyme